MQIGMKLNPETVERLAEALQSARQRRGLTFREIAFASGIEVSRVQKICAGDFVVLNQTVMQICINLDVFPSIGTATDAFYERKLASGIIAIWDRSPEDARRLMRLLDDLAELRRRPDARPA
jgi:transcriptional regulator with XRE-family HTH domain